jgi:hypothetical protein
MTKKAIKNDDLLKDIVEDDYIFPKYTTQIMNLANSNAQGTRPRVVGQMSELIQECPEKTLEGWKNWYKNRYPDALENATIKVFEMIENLKEAIKQIDKNLVRLWVEDLVINKTFAGMKFQSYLIEMISKEKGKKFRLAEPHEESKGIDGYIGDLAVSVKPLSYKTKPMLQEGIQAKMIYYEKTKTGLVIEYDF